MADSEKRIADGKLTREIKRQKFEAKQSRKKEEARKENLRNQWFQSNEFASLVSEEDVNAIVSGLEWGDDLSLRKTLLPYFDVQDKSSKEAASQSSKDRLFIAEGTETIRILIQQQSTQSGYDGLKPIKLSSIFVKPCLLFDPPVRLLADVEEAKARDHNEFKVLVGSEAVLSTVAGFPISRGALACGVVPTDRDEIWLYAFLTKKLGVGKRTRILAMDGICDNANLGSMVRCASAFGVDVIVLSHDTCDCWYRRTIRVSMGHIFKVPIVRVDRLADTLKKFHEHFSIPSYAAILETNNLLTGIKHGTLDKSWCCIMGNESCGISEECRKASTHCIRIQIASGVDSLSVSVACGILLNGLREREI